jgi:hypothetical protein
LEPGVWQSGEYARDDSLPPLPPNEMEFLLEGIERDAAAVAASVKAMLDSLHLFLSQSTEATQVHMHTHLSGLCLPLHITITPAAGTLLVRSVYRVCGVDSHLSAHKLRERVVNYDTLSPSSKPHSTNTGLGPLVRQ